MRWALPVPVIAAAMTASPVMSAEAPSVFDQYMAARSVFLADTDDASAYDINYRKALFEGIAGRWFPISVLQPKSADLELFRQACDRPGLRIWVQDAYTLGFTTGEGTDRQATSLYTHRFGATFGEYAHAGELLHRLGLDTAPVNEGMVSSLLRTANGSVTMTRPSPDILVMQKESGPPTIYARCPAG